jgi:hypothetical protein
MRRFAAVVVLVLLAGTGLFACSSDPGPEQALRAFLDGWSSGNLNGVSLESPDGTALASADVTKQIEALAGDLVATKAKLNPAGDPQTDEGKSTATVNVEWTVADGLVWSYQTTVHLREVEKSWRVVFAPDTVHPQLKADNHLSVESIAADRGSILDGAGEAIVKERPVVTVGIEPQRITNQGSLLTALGAAFKSVGVSIDLADLPGASRRRSRTRSSRSSRCAERRTTRSGTRSVICPAPYSRRARSRWRRRGPLPEPCSVRSATSPGSSSTRTPGSTSRASRSASPVSSSSTTICSRGPRE